MHPFAAMVRWSSQYVSSVLTLSIMVHRALITKTVLVLVIFCSSCLSPLKLQCSIAHVASGKLPCNACSKKRPPAALMRDGAQRHGLDHLLQSQVVQREGPHTAVQIYLNVCQPQGHLYMAVL